jgi:hypothetical protein
MDDDEEGDYPPTPSTEEKISLRADLATVNKELEELDTDIAELLGRLSNLKADRSRLRDEQAHILHRIGPTSLGLPDEILSDIFELATTVSARVPGVFRRGVHWSRVISHVSRRWRNIALQNPFLWTWILIAQGLPSTTIWAPILLERSKTSLIDVELSLTDSPEGMSDALDLVIPHMGRWSSFHFSGKWAMAVAAHSRLDRQSVPYLQSVEFSTLRYNSNAEVATAMTVPFSGFAPKLAFLALRWTTAELQPFDFPNLKRLELRRCYHDGGRIKLSYIRAVLNSCPLLENLILEQCPIQDDLDDVLPAINLPQLSLLSFESFPSHEIFSFLSIISAPKLSDLSICKTDGPLLLFSDYFLENNDPFPKLENLALTHENVWPRGEAELFDDEVRAADCILRSLGSICGIRIAGRKWAPAVMEAIKDDPDLCPNLSTIQCSDIDIRPLYEVVSDREFSDVPIEALRLSRALGDSMSNYDMEWFNDRVDEVKVLKNP